MSLSDSTGRGVWHDSPEGREVLQARLALFAQVIVGLLLFALVMNVAFFAAFPGSLSRPRGSLGLWIHLGIAAFAGVMGVFCRRGARGAATLVAVDVAIPAVTSIGLAGSVLLGQARFRPELGILLGLTHLLVLRAALVPSTPTRTLVIGAASSIPMVVATWLLYGRGPRPEGFPTPLGAVVIEAAWCAVALAGTAITSRVIYGLRMAVREARHLGQYTLDEKIGEGGMGVLYKASHAMLRRPTAIKLLPRDRAHEADIRRFEREVLFTSQLKHPNTIAIFDYGRTHDGVFYYAMEYLEGIDLEDLVAEDGPQAPGRVVFILRQVCGALAEAHRAGIIHRDIKPANILLCDRGGVHDFVKVVDFGLVKSVKAGGEAAVTSADAITGTPLYLSPEAISTPGEIDARSDLYAVGAVAYFLVTGTPVFDGVNIVEICSHHLLSRPDRPSARLGRAVPSDLEDLILACLEKDPARRPESAEALADALGAGSAAGSWDEPRARAWWAEHNERLAKRRAKKSAEKSAEQSAALGSTVEIDIHTRKATRGG